MNYQLRSAFPSQTQIEALMLFLEEHPRLAAGFPTLPSARDRTRKLWEKQSLYLNSLEGSIKSWRQWRKYWADKKSAVKKKAAQRSAMRGKISDEMKEVIRLTDTEERILSVIGGDGLITDDRHLGYDAFRNVQPPTPSTDKLSTCPTVVVKIEQSETSPFDSMEDQAEGALSISMTDKANAPSPLAATASACSIPNLQASNHTASRDSSPNRNVPRRPRNINLRRTRRMTQPAAMYPPSQLRSQFVNIAERFLRVEESRLEMDRRYATIVENLLERDVERDRSIAQALSSLGDSLKLIANALNK